MYEIYQTDAFVLKNELRREGDVRVVLFTRDFGLVYANVTSAKKESSKMRNFLQVYSFINVYLIHGKLDFRVTGGEFKSNLYFEGGLYKKEKAEILKNVFSFMEYVFLKKESDDELFDLFLDFYERLLVQEKLDKINSYELVFMTKLLHKLGYYDDEFFSFDKVFSKDESSVLRKKINEILKNYF